MNQFLLGTRYLIDGFSLIAKPGLKRFVVIPFLINLILFTALFFLMRHYAHLLNEWLAQFLPTWLQWLTFIFWLIFFISFVIVFIYTFVAVANLIASPFNSLLAEKVEFYLTGHMAESKSLFAHIRDTPRILGRQFAIIGFYLPRAILCLILFFIPIVHLFAGLLWFFFNAWFFSLTYVDYPSDNQQVALHEVREWLTQKRWITIGFGVSALLVAMIPIFNFFVIPAAVAGATKFWIEQRQIKSL